MWDKIAKSKNSPDKRETDFIPNMIKDFYSVLSGISIKDDLSSSLNKSKVRYCEKFLEWVIDLLTQLPTRRYFKPLLQDMHFVVKCRRSSLNHSEDTSGTLLFLQLVQMVRFYEGFEINEVTGQPLSEEAMNQKHAQDISLLQSIAFQHFPDELKRLSLASISVLDSKEGMIKHLRELDNDQLVYFAHILGLEKEKKFQVKIHESREFVEEIISTHYEKRISQIELIQEMPIYPTEKLLWDTNVVPEDNYTDTATFALPKLNLQFLSANDYLMRNFDLYRIESARGIRDRIEDAISRTDPRKVTQAKTANTKGIIFHGWSRMGKQIIFSTRLCFTKHFAIF